MAVGGLAEVRAMLTAEGGQRKREAELLSSANSKLSKLADLATQLVSAGAQVAEEENNTSNAAAAAAAASAGCMQRFPEGSPPAVSKKQAFFTNSTAPLQETSKLATRGQTPSGKECISCSVLLTEDNWYQYSTFVAKKQYNCKTCCDIRRVENTSAEPVAMLRADLPAALTGWEQDVAAHAKVIDARTSLLTQQQEATAAAARALSPAAAAAATPPPPPAAVAAASEGSADVDAAAAAQAARAAEALAAAADRTAAAKAPLPPFTTPTKVNGEWAQWVLSLVAAQRNRLIAERGFSKEQVLDLRKVARKYKRALAQRRYHKKKATAAGTNHCKPGRPPRSRGPTFKNK